MSDSVYNKEKQLIMALWSMRKEQTTAIARLVLDEMTETQLASLKDKIILFMKENPTSQPQPRV